jgi:hypothetical protein
MLEWDQIKKFVEYCQNDMRKILIQLDELKINYGNKNIDSNITTLIIAFFLYVFVH